ncbi:hypothetical protein PR202_gb03357 [Eleusine coracana subsp. coracana]|uniref:YDG domain-containing protein n=1 Tax=Eleusine coracana subsp. coracana TaxID=191504 RepID=A0AAV5E049_ELECO|nr:hypothetical protein PR202_gb03357 [Eleusine coracana subsp. coracana]
MPCLGARDWLPDPTTSWPDLSGSRFRVFSPPSPTPSPNPTTASAAPPSPYASPPVIVGPEGNRRPAGMGMDSREMKPRSPPPGAGTSTRSQRGDPPPPPRHPSPPPPGHAANGLRGEGRGAVRAREEAEGAGAGDTGREAGRTAGAVGAHGAREASGSAEAREERVADGTGMKRRLLPRPEKQPPKQWAVREEYRVPAGWCKDSAIPLGRHRDADSSRPRAAGDDGGSAALGKAAPRPPLAGSKDGVLLEKALPRAAGSNVVNKVPAAAGGARPMAGGGHRGADTRVVKSSEASRRSNVATADGLLDTTSSSQGAAGSMVKDMGMGAGTGKLQRKESVPSMRLLPKPKVFASTRHSPNENTSGNRLQSWEKIPPQNLARDGKVLNISGGGSCNVVAKSSAQGPSKEHPLIKVVDASDSNEKFDCKVVHHLKDDDVLKTIGISESELILYISNCSHCSSLRCQRQHGVQNAADARRKFKMICRRFQFICRVLVQAVEQHLLILDGGRVDNVADRAMKDLPDFKPGPVEGEVPGVEIGDEFLYRVQLTIVGLHRITRGGIDWTNDRNGTPIAVSIVCSGGYPDEVLRSGELIYTGSGGKLAGKKHDANQELKRGNLALKNCIETKTPVRVIYGFKSDNVEGHSHSRAKQITTYIYDGLYHVVRFCKEGNPGSRMFKYTLRRISGQPELPLRIAEKIRKSKMRGLK